MKVCLLTASCVTLMWARTMECIFYSFWHSVHRAELGAGPLLSAQALWDSFLHRDRKQ